MERPTLASDACFQASVLASNRGAQPSVAARSYVEYWHGADEPWRWANRGEPKRPVDESEVVAAEEERKALVEEEDGAAAGDGATAGGDGHAERLHGWGVSVQFLVAFTFAHDCWDWPTWRVVRDIIKPATAGTRCRYAQLPEMSPHVASAAVFMSHCWGASWGDLVCAAADGASDERVVWIDVFAVRQWPGNTADLDFRGVVSRCKAMIVAVTVEEELARWELRHAREREEFLERGGEKKKHIAFFRLWSVGVPIHKHVDNARGRAHKPRHHTANHHTANHHRCHHRHPRNLSGALWSSQRP